MYWKLSTANSVTISVRWWIRNSTFWHKKLHIKDSLIHRLILAVSQKKKYLGSNLHQKRCQITTLTDHLLFRWIMLRVIIWHLFCSYFFKNETLISCKTLERHFFTLSTREFCYAILIYMCLCNIWIIPCPSFSNKLSWCAIIIRTMLIESGRTNG